MDAGVNAEHWVNILQQRVLKPHEDILQLEKTKLPLELEILLDLSEEHLGDVKSRGRVLSAMEGVIQHFAIDLNHTFEEAMAVVRGAGVRWSPDNQLFPWLPWPDRNIQVQLGLTYLPSVLDLSRPLTQQKIEGGMQKVAAVTLQPSILFHVGSQLEQYLFFGTELARPSYSIDLASVVVESAKFEHGSFKAIAKVVLEIVVLVVPLTAAPLIQDKYNEYRFKQKIEMKVAGQPCTLQATWKHDVESLRRIGLEALDFTAPGLSPIERRERICNAQLAMKLGQGSPDSIDGVWGRISQASLAHFAKQRGLPADIKSEQLRGELHQVFLNRENK